VNLPNYFGGAQLGKPKIYQMQNEYSTYPTFLEQIEVELDGSNTVEIGERLPSQI